MCGIVGAIADRNVVPILLEGLRRLEYRGYDSAGMALLDEIERRDLVNKSIELGDYFRRHLRKLAEKQSLIGDVRGMGLMQAIELVGENKSPNAEAVGKLFEETKKEGVLIGKGGLFNNVIRISPPLNISKSEVDDFIKIMDAALGNCV